MEVEVEMCTVVIQINIFLILFWKKWPMYTKDKKDLQDFYQKQVQKPGSVMAWGCNNALVKGHLYLCDGGKV